MEWLLGAVRTVSQELLGGQCSEIGKGDLNYLKNMIWNQAAVSKQSHKVNRTLQRTALRVHERLLAIS